MRCRGTPYTPLAGLLPDTIARPCFPLFACNTLDAQFQGDARQARPAGGATRANTSTEAAGRAQHGADEEAEAAILKESLDRITSESGRSCHPSPRNTRRIMTIITRRRPKRRLALILGAMALSSSAFAAGIDSRTYTCADLQAVIRAQGFVFISQPAFGDFVVDNSYYCGGSAPRVELRSVPTTDRPECLLNYCKGKTPPG